MRRRRAARLLGWLFAVAAAAGIATAAAVPWRLDRVAVGREVNEQTATWLGADARVDGAVTLKILPRPRLQMNQVSVRAGGGSVLVDVPEVKAELDIASLLLGRWRLASATLVAPTVTVALDRIGSAGIAGSLATDRAAPALRVRSRSGVLRVVSADPAADLLLSNIDLAATLPSAGGTLSGTGTLLWRGAPARFSARIERLADLAAPGGSAASLQITSPTLSLSADGMLWGDPQRRFAGHLAALIPSLPRLLEFPVGAARAGSGRLQISGDVAATAHGLAFSDAAFRVDGSRFEGTLAIRRDAARLAVEGTLATDLLDLDGVLADATGQTGLASLYRRPLAAEVLAADLDLRVSASKARIGRLTLDDAALTVLARDGRLELGLDEATLCGGRVKGRAVTQLGPTGAATHAEATAARVDVAALSAALGGDGQIGGILSGEATVEGAGSTLREIVAALDGRGQVSVEKGRISGLSLGRTLSRFGARVPIDGFRGDRPTVFDKAVWAFSVEHGVLKIPDGRLTAPGVAMSFSGETRLPDGRIDLAGTAVETDGAGALVSGSPRLPFTMRGSWDGSLVLVGHAGMAGLPSLVLPLIGTAPPSP